MTSSRTVVSGTLNGRCHTLHEYDEAQSVAGLGQRRLDAFLGSEHGVQELRIVWQFGDQLAGRIAPGVVDRLDMPGPEVDAGRRVREAGAAGEFVLERVGDLEEHVLGFDKCDFGLKLVAHLIETRGPARARSQ